MSDLISRQDAIDVLEVLCQEHRYKIPGNAETYSQYNEAWQDALDRAEGDIGNLPSAEPKTVEWIPCSERLPEVNGRYLCANDQWGAWRVDINMWVNGHWRNQIEKPIAWIPLPDPWKGGE